MISAEESMSGKRGLRSLTNAPLSGFVPVYFIYVDEAGTSAREPVTIVVAVMIHADRHWKMAADHLESVLDEFVPSQIREGFIFHAKDVWSGYRELDEVWPRQARADCIAAVASIPRFMPTAISLGLVRRDFDVEVPIPKLSLADFHHIHAFWRCIARANKYVRDWGEPSEVATVVAEDVTDKRRFLRDTIKLVSPDYTMDETTTILTEEEKATGTIVQTTAPGPIDKIIDTVHFVDKGGAPLLQIADACAFSFRRYFAQQSFGAEMVEAMLGTTLIPEEWRGSTSEYTFSFDPNHAYPRRV